MRADVVIVGAGPAGCATALALRALDHSVVLVGSRGESARSFETAAPALAPLLRGLDVAHLIGMACSPCFGVSAQWGSEQSSFDASVMNPFGHGFQIDRPRFDDGLLNEAIKAGAVAAEARVVDAHRDPEGVALRLSTADQFVEARVLVDASGTRARFARLLGAKRVVLDRLYSFSAMRSVSQSERIVFVEAVESGWWYLIPGAAMKALVGFVTDTPSARHERLAEPAQWVRALGQTSVLSSMVSDAKLPPGVRVEMAGTSRLDRCHDTGWIAVGDAAISLDPLGSAGVVKALDSGIRASNAISCWLRGDDQEAVRYAEETERLFQAYWRERAAQYSAERRWTQSAFWSQRRAVSLQLNATAFGA